MGEYVWTDINIGGKVSASVAAELREMLDAEFGGAEAEIVGAHLYAGGERNYGNADEVESFCQEHGLPYVLTWAAASGCFDAGSHAWRPGMEQAAEVSATDDGDPSAPLAYLKHEASKGRTLADIIEELSIGDASALPPYVEEAGPDAYEIAARAAGWRDYEHGVFHPASNNYADDWRAACGVSKVGPDHPGQVEAVPSSSPSVADVLARAESFIAGFEDDEEQEGVTELLRDLRAAQGKEG